MPLYIIGLGLGDEQDITIKGAEAIKKCDRIFLEAYTSILGVSTEKLEAAYEKKVELAHRETVESEAETILLPAKEQNIAFLVVGDPFGATTHTDLLIRAQQLEIPTHVIHNASIMNAIGACGLQLYNFGQTISIPFFRKEWRPDSFYDKIVYNSEGGMHTLCLLDIKVREPNYDNLLRFGRMMYDPPRFMTINTAIEQLLEIETTRSTSTSSSTAAKGICKPTSLAIGVARIGQSNQCIVSGTLEELRTVDFGAPLHSLVLVGHMHELEQALFDHFRVKPDTPRLPLKTDNDDDNRSTNSDDDNTDHQTNIINSRF